MATKSKEVKVYDRRTGSYIGLLHSDEGGHVYIKVPRMIGLLVRCRDMVDIGRRMCRALGGAGVVTGRGA